MKWINKLFGYNSTESNQKEAMDEVVNVFKNATATNALVISPREEITNESNKHTVRSLNKLNKKGSTFSSLSGPPKLNNIIAFFI